MKLTEAQMKDVAAYTGSVIKSDRRRACHPRLEEYGLVPEAR